MILSNIKLKDLFILVFIPALFLSEFLLDTFFFKSGEKSFIYLNRNIFLLFILMLSFYGVLLFNSIKKLFSDRKIIKIFIFTCLMTLSMYFLTPYFYFTGPALFFLNSFIITFLTNTIVSFVIAFIVKKYFLKKV